MKENHLGFHFPFSIYIYIYMYIYIYIKYTVYIYQYLYISKSIYIFMLPFQYKCMENRTNEKRQLHLFAAFRKWKQQTSVGFRKTENGRKFLFLGWQTIDGCCCSLFSKGAHLWKVVILDRILRNIYLFHSCSLTLTVSIPENSADLWTGCGRKPYSSKNLLLRTLGVKKWTCQNVYVFGVKYQIFDCRSIFQNVL
jgi:hypothetical protein